MFAVSAIFKIIALKTAGKLACSAISILLTYS